MLSGEIALKNNHYYYYYYSRLNNVGPHRHYPNERSTHSECDNIIYTIMVRDTENTMQSLIKKAFALTTM